MLASLPLVPFALLYRIFRCPFFIFSFVRLFFLGGFLSFCSVAVVQIILVVVVSLNVTDLLWVVGFLVGSMVCNSYLL